MNHFVSNQFGDITLCSGISQYSLFDSFGNMKTIGGIVSYPDYGEAYKIAHDKGLHVRAVTFDFAKRWGLNHAKKVMFNKFIMQRVYL